MNDGKQSVHAVGYSEEWSWAHLEREWDLGEYPEVMLEAFLEVLTALEDWAVPLAVGLVFRPPEETFVHSVPGTMLLAGELTDELELEEDWQSWAEPLQVDRITGDIVRQTILERLEVLQQKGNRAYELNSIRFLAFRFAVGPASMPEEFLLAQSYSGGVRSLRTTTSNGKRWISEPQVGRTPQMLPVEIEVTGVRTHDYKIRLRMSPSWSYFGDRDEPGWQMIVDTTERLLTMSDAWSVTRLQPGDPAKR